MSDSLASMTTITIVFTLLLVLVVYGARTLFRGIFSVLDNVPAEVVIDWYLTCPSLLSGF
jgi:hypothetical protein